MIRSLALCLILGAALPAGADCPAPEALTKVTFNSGAVIEILGREGDVLTYRQTVVETGRVVEMTVQSGLYTLTALRDGEGAVFDWKTALPGVADLVPGAVFTAEAMLTTPGFLPPRPFAAKVTVVGPEEVTVAGCTYDALKVVVENAEAGKPLGVNTKWLQLDSLISLRSEIAEGGEVKVQEVVAFE
jgi:hypothetical protein